MLVATTLYSICLSIFIICNDGTEYLSLECVPIFDTIFSQAASVVNV